MDSSFGFDSGCDSDGCCAFLLSAEGASVPEGTVGRVSCGEDSVAGGVCGCSISGLGCGMADGLALPPLPQADNISVPNKGSMYFPGSIVFIVNVLLTKTNLLNKGKNKKQHHSE
ncbi:hypothetical protein [Neisseria dentiae]|uniref:hypothetical protein n=1 Tax=Neisseria dentiae TaxID=194197 RepID=UPI00211CD461|nr:hypothetical protein [Neisseria dentiae]